DDHFVIGGIAATHEEGGEASALAGGVNDRTRQETNSIGGGRGLHGFQLACFEGGNAGAGFFGQRRSSGGGHNHRFRCRGEMRVDREGFVGARAVGRLEGTTWG